MSDTKHTALPQFTEPFPLAESIKVLREQNAALVEALTWMLELANEVDWRKMQGINAPVAYNHIVAAEAALRKAGE